MAGPSAHARVEDLGHGRPFLVGQAGRRSRRFAFHGRHDAARIPEGRQKKDRTAPAQGGLYKKRRLCQQVPEHAGVTFLRFACEEHGRGGKHGADDVAKAFQKALGNLF